MDNLDRLNLQNKQTRENFISGRQGKRKSALSILNTPSAASTPTEREKK
jgi:hypothetical protein